MKVPLSSIIKITKARLRKKNHIIIAFAVLLNLFYLVTTFLNDNIGYIKPVLTTNILYVKTIVDKTRDLLDVDTSFLLQHQNRDKLGIMDSIHDLPFVTKRPPGYVLNVDLNQLKEEISNDERIKMENAFMSDKELLDNYDKVINCSHIRYENQLEVYPNPENFKLNFTEVRNHLKNNTKVPNAKEYFLPDEKDWPEDEIITKRWSGFGTAPVWIASENCYVAYTRVVYSKENRRDVSYMSLAYAQAYDKNWNELYDKRIFFRDTEMPQETKNELESLKSELETMSCKNMKEKSEEYKKCLSKFNEKKIKLEKKIDAIYDDYSINYPSVLRVPFVMQERWNGPEDSHVVLKRDKEGSEPVVIFNMGTPKGRKMHAFLPHRKNNSLVEFNIKGKELRGSEKNWAPFFNEKTSQSSNTVPGFIHFVYDFNPMEILRCSLTDGQCDQVLKASDYGLSTGETNFLRGGTQYIPLPDIIPQVNGKNIWIGFIKGHTGGCNCGGKFYRPQLSVLIEKEGVYHLELISPVVDFAEEVLGWNLEDYHCRGYNVLSPSSIANWYVTSQDPKTKKFEDYMVLAVSEADFISKRIDIRGVLNYVLGIYDKFDINDSFSLGQNAKVRLQKASTCVLESFQEGCRLYGETHND